MSFLPENPAPQDPTGWPRQVSGLVWAVIFYVSTFMLWQMLAASISGFVEDRLLLTAAPLTAAALLLSFILPRPEGVPARGGLGLGGERRAPLFGLGFAVAAAAGAAIVLGSVAAGELTIGVSESPARFGSFLATAATLALAGLGEELFFRGYGFQQLGRAITPKGAAIFTGLAFGFVHGNNPEVSEVALANTVFFGILFGLCVAWSRSLWLPIGLHLGWNFSLATLGAPISGLRIKVTALETAPVGGSLWDGGAYGPEGGIAASLAVLLMALLLSKAGWAETAGRLIWEDGEPGQGG